MVDSDEVRQRAGRDSRASTSPEIDLINRAVRVVAPGAGVDLGSWEPDCVDWPRLMRLANDHGVMALVARSLKAQGWHGVPPKVVETFVGYRAALMARNIFLTHRLLEVVSLLGAHGIEALPHKGPLLAAYAYGDVGMRPFSDLDIIVSPTDVMPAKALLEAEGYCSLSPRTDSELSGALPPGYALAMRSAEDRVLIELHWKLAPSFPLTIDGLLPSARPFPLLGSTVPCLCPEQFLLVLCVHGSKHAWERLEWICSVAHLIAGQPTMDWDRVASEAKALGARRSVALGLALAVGTGAPVPDAAMRALGAAAVKALATEVEAGLLRIAPGTGDPVVRYSLRFRTASLPQKVRYLLFLRHPTEKDREFVTLPRRLSFLYVLVRPVRVVSEHAPGRVGHVRERAGRHQAQRALARQLEHQERKVAALAGRDEMMLEALIERWGRVHHRLQRIKPGWSDPRMLEVGSGAHGLLFGSGSARAVGIDPLAVEYAGLFPSWQRRIPTVAAAGEHLPFADGTFDVVLCDNVVDHAEQPAAVVGEMIRMLAPGGLLYFTVNVHHRLYSLVAQAHRAWNAAGIPVEIGPFADHTVHLTPAEARAMFDGHPLDIRRERTYVAEAKERARHRRLRHPGHLVPMVFFKNARFEIIAQRR